MQVPQIDIKAIFEKRAGHPSQPKTRVIVCGDKSPEFMDNAKTLNGTRKPGAFTIAPAVRREQFL